MARAKSTTRLQVSTRWPQYRRELHASIRHGIEAGSAAGARAAAAAAPRGDGRRGSVPGYMASTIQPMTIQKRRMGGYRGGFGSHDRTMLYLAAGTRGRRARKVLSSGSEAARKASRATKSGRAVGIRPNPFVRRALVQVALPVAVATMRASSSRISTGSLR